MSRPLDGIDPASVRTELAVVQNEARVHATSTPYRVAAALVAESLFGTAHPYGRAGIRNQVDHVTLEELQAFVALHYHPSNAILVVGGRFDEVEVRQLVSRYFGWIPSPPSPVRERRPLARLGRDALAVYDAPVRSRMAVAGWLVFPPDGDGYEEMRIARGAIAQRARQKLMTEEHLVDDVQVEIVPGHMGSMLLVETELRPLASTERLAAAIDRVMSEIATLGRTFEWEGFDDVRRTLATSFIRGLELPSSRAWWIQNELEYFGVVRSPADEVARIQRIRPSDVGSAVRQLVVDAKRSLVVLEPDPIAPATGARR